VVFRDVSMGQKRSVLRLHLVQIFLALNLPDSLHHSN
jgi:hypothetical protein